jgi:hypothetical protein
MDNTNKTIYKFKKDDPEYKINRHKHLIELTKQRYQTDPDFKNKMLETSRNYYKNLKELANKNL